ncbi:hypothetical protein [Paraburkholderia sp. WSM4175]|uniref:hypothetical protein n=1 Tax=Paraburkholderia sp. WSM4175 TaxID=2991072 RepID=UPI003D1DFC02
MNLSELNRLLVSGLICMAVMVPLHAFSDQSSANVLSIDTAGAIQVCNTKSGCKNIAPTADLKKAIDDGYENISIVDIYKDGNQEVAATSTGGCSRFFFI